MDKYSTLSQAIHLCLCQIQIRWKFSSSCSISVTSIFAVSNCAISILCPGQTFSSQLIPFTWGQASSLISYCPLTISVSGTTTHSCVNQFHVRTSIYLSFTPSPSVSGQHHFQVLLLLLDIRIFVKNSLHQYLFRWGKVIVCTQSQNIKKSDQLSYTRFVSVCQLRVHFDHPPSTVKCGVQWKWQSFRWSLTSVPGHPWET